MLETSIITFREGMEMFLIVAIMFAYLTKTGRNHLKEPVYWGVGVAAIVSVTTGWHIAELAEDPLMEGMLALTAGVLVATMTYTVMKAAGTLKKVINDKIEIVAQKDGMAAMVGMFVFTFVMIVREGMETAMMLGAMSGNVNDGELIMGALLGFAIVGVIGYVWIKQSYRINLRLFMQATGIFLMMFCLHLFMYGFHELTEVAAVPFIDNFKWHTLTEPFESGEPIGDLYSIAMVVVPLAWMAYSYGWDKYIAPRLMPSAAE
jgi:high-affinity iron transporter